MASPRASALVVVLAAAVTGVASCGLVESAANKEDASPVRDARPVVDAFDAPAVVLGDGHATTCAECLVAACTDAYDQCVQSDACFGVYQCAVAGADDAGACACQGGASASSPFLALSRCVEGAACGTGACATLCSQADAGLGGLLACGALATVPACVASRGDASPLAASSTAECEACVASACGSFVSACGEGSDCQRYLACNATFCGDACADRCESLPVDGRTAADALDVCIGGACQAACGF